MESVMKQKRKKNEAWKRMKRKPIQKQKNIS